MSTFIYVPASTAVISPNGIVAHLLALVKNLSAAVEVPSTAFKSAKPILTSPIAEAFTTEKSTYVLPTLVLEKD